MRVLLAGMFTAQSRRPIGGVQSWIHTVQCELERRGHEVATFCRGQRSPTGTFDVGILANWRTTAHLASRCKAVLNVSHGIIEPEKPGHRNVAFTSEEVRDHWGDGPVIRQPIDLDFWQDAPTEPRFLTWFSYRAPADWTAIVARSMGLEFRQVSGMAPQEVRGILWQSACVLATGRAALEAMASGVPVVICDNRSEYMASLLDTDTIGSMTRNYSGRGGQPPSAVSVTAACLRAMGAGSLRMHVVRHHDARKVVDQLLEAACSGC